MKQPYSELEIEIIEFSNEDIITSSPTQTQWPAPNPGEGTP